MQRLLVCIFALGATACFAQPQFLQPGAEWWYSIKGGFIHVEGWHHVFYEKDTVVANFACKKLLDEQVVRSGSAGSYIKNAYPIFMRQKGDSVFIYDNPVWLLRWRTNPTPGARYLIQKYGWNNQYFGEITVDSIRQVNINGLLVNKIYQHGVFGSGAISQGSGSVVIYSHIGPAYGVFDYSDCWGTFDCYDSYLCSYKNNAVPLYHFNGSNCDVISDAHQVIADIETSISPNPCQEEIVFDFGQGVSPKTGRLLIVDESGRQFRSLDLVPAGRVQIETASLPAGMYFYVFSGERRTFAGKFIKQE